MLPKDVPFVGKLSDDLCLSGGARGADATWGEEAAKFGHQVIHWSFEGHKSFGNPEHTVILDEETLKQADERLEMANESLKRHLPYHKPWLMSLLRRNWFQVQYAEEVWVVGNLTERASIEDQDRHITQHTDKLGIDGGTAWACQMYLDKFIEKRHEMYKISPMLPLEPELFQFKLVFYDQITELSYTFNPTSRRWINIFPVTGHPTGIYAAIGSRNLNDAGKAYILQVYNDPR